MSGAQNGPWMDEAQVGARQTVTGSPVGYIHGMTAESTDGAGVGVWEE